MTDILKEKLLALINEGNARIAARNKNRLSDHTVVRLLGPKAKDCPTRIGVVFTHGQGKDEYVILYHNGKEKMFGLFKRRQLKPIYAPIGAPDTR